jgi:hypothetical protein
MNGALPLLPPLYVFVQAHGQAIFHKTDRTDMSNWSHSLPNKRNGLDDLDRISRT